MWADEIESGESSQDEDEVVLEELIDGNSVKSVLTEVSTLSNICLNSVCENIDRHNTAFHHSTDSNMKWNLMCMRRFYSKKIIMMLMERRGDISLDKKYFDLLINEFLKELDFYIFEADDLNIISELLPKIGHTVENVSFNFNSTVQYRFQFSEEETYLGRYVEKALLHLPNVKVIRMVCLSSCNDHTLEVIYSSCKELKELYLERCPITSTGLMNLCPEDRDNTLSLQLLELVFIHDCDEGASYLLKNLPTLECMAYENLPNILHQLHADDLRNNSLDNVPKYNLTSLCVDATLNFQRNVESFEETLLIASELCPRVSKISVIDIMTEEQLQMLNKFSDLSEVRIQGDLDWLDVGDFLQHSGKKIKHLELKKFKLTLSTLVENCPNLEYMRLEDIDYHSSENEKDVNLLKNAKKLVLVRVDNNESSDMFIKLLLDSCSNLCELEFLGCTCDEEQMSGIIQKFCEQSKTLEKLTFMSCPVKEALLQHIVLTCTPLKELVIDLCENIGSYEIENLLDTIKTSKSSVMIDFTSRSGFFYSNDDDDVDYLDLDDEDLDYLDDSDIDDLSQDSWEDVDARFSFGD